MTALHLRSARADDAARLAEVYLNSRKTLLPYAPLAHEDDDVRRWIREVLIPAGRVCIALRGDEIVGMLATSVDDQAHGWIDQLYLAPAHVGQGFGSTLLMHALDTLPRPVRLYTFQPNHGARRFYERHGFVAIAFGDGSGNEEGCPDVLYELA